MNPSDPYETGFQKKGTCQKIPYCHSVRNLGFRHLSLGGGALRGRKRSIRGERRRRDSTVFDDILIVRQLRRRRLMWLRLMLHVALLREVVETRHSERVGRRQRHVLVVAGTHKAAGEMSSSGGGLEDEVGVGGDGAAERGREG